MMAKNKKKDRWGKLTLAQVEALLNDFKKNDPPMFGLVLRFASFELLREQRHGWARLIRSRGMRKMCEMLPTLQEKLNYIASVIECD